MASLPPGWAADYDGARWFFRYAATDHTQYHFPTPGDEFPDFYSSLLAPPGGDGGGGESLLSGGSGGEQMVLLPEERLESERQVRKRAAGDGGGGRRHRGEQGHKKEEEEEDGDEGGGEMCFDAFGYLGPGGYDDVKGSPENNEDGAAAGGVAHELANKSKRRPSVDAVSSLASTGTGDVAAPVSEPLDHRVFTIISDEHQQQPQAQPQPPAVEVSSSSAASAATLTASGPQAQRHRSDDLPMLDSREIVPSPVGYIAELVSESTARCEEEINPPPVELPDTNGASWLEPVPVPNLVNQYPVELPAVKNRDSVLETLGARRETFVDVCRDQQGELVVACKKLATEDENRAAWQTNWMSTSASTTSPPQGDGPPRPPKIVSRSDLPTRHRPRPEIVPKPSPRNESLHRETLDHFPAEPQQHKRVLQTTTDSLGVESSSNGHNTTRHMSMPPVAPNTSRFPSVLRPGPRRSSQPPFLATTAPGSQHLSSTPLGQEQQASVPPSSTGAEYKAFNPTPAATSRPHSQSAAEQPTSAPPQLDGIDTVVRMPNPKDHVRPLRLPRSSTLPTPEQQPPPPASPPAQDPRPREPLHFVIPVYHSPTARANGNNLPRRPDGFVKMPSEPARSVGMASAPAPPLQARRASDGAPEVYLGGNSPGLQHLPLSQKTSPPMMEAPDTGGEAPLALVESASTSFATVAASNVGRNRLRQMIKRIGRIDKGENVAGTKPAFTVIGEEGSQPMPHDYIPPKGRRKEASEWSLGHVG